MSVRMPHSRSAHVDAAPIPAILAAAHRTHAPSTVDLHALLRYRAAAFTAGTRLPVTLAFAEDGCSLAPTEAAHLARVLDESFSNIARHAHAFRVSLSTRRVSGRLYVRLQDNGMGCDPSRAVGGPGLARMRHHAILAGARVWLETAPYEGTTVVFELPAAPA